MSRALRLLVVLALLVPLSSQAQSPGLERQLQDVLEAFLAENGVAPGAMACAVCPALQLDWSAAAGTAAKGDTTPLTTRHTFRIASNTKSYVAAAALQLVEMGQLGLDDPLRQHLSEAQAALLERDGYDTDRITIAQVLSHTAGLGDHTDDPRFEEFLVREHTHQWTPEEQIERLVEWRDPVGEPGERFEYSDSGYVLLGGIIQRLTGRQLGPAVRQLVGFEKFGLGITHWEYMEAAPATAGPRAHQYFGDVDVTDYNASFDLYGGGGIVTDVHELTSFMRALLKGQVFARESTLTEMTGRGTPVYRLGLMVMDFDGWIAFGHQGFWNTFVFHVPSLDLTVGGCVLNHKAANGKDLARRLVGAVAGASTARQGR